MHPPQQQQYRATPALGDSRIERFADAQQEIFSFRDIISRVFLRPKMALFALLVPPLIAVGLTALVPVEWAASTKILIRYSGAESTLLKDLIPEARLGLSGTTSAELIKSTPVVQQTIVNVGIRNEDIYTKPFNVISDRLSGLFASPSSAQTDGASEQPVYDEHGQPQASNLSELTKKFKESLESSSKKSGTAKSIEILEKTSQVPESMKLDELITLQVKSFNREKVALMANGLAAAFIEEYYRLYTEEAKRQYEYLDTLVNQESTELAAMESATPADFANGSVKSSSGRELITRDIPILTSMADQLMEVESSLARMRQIYSASSPQVSRLRSQAESLRFLFKKQERIEISKQVLEQLKMRRYQASNALNIYKDRLVPISIAEEATTPKASSSKKLMRIAVSGVVGLMLGGIFALGLMIILNILDPRIHFRQDIEKLVSLPILSYLPRLSKKFKLSNAALLREDKHIEHGILQIITSIRQQAEVGTANIISVTSPAVGDGATFCALALALNLAKNRHKKVCLIDANFADAAITDSLGMRANPGLIDAISEQTPLRQAIVHQSALNLAVLPVGSAAKKPQLGYYADQLPLLLQELKLDYDYVVIDAGAVFSGNEAAIFGTVADETLLVVSSGVTRKGMLQAASNKLALMGVNISGLVLNRHRDILPGFIYRNL